MKKKEKKEKKPWSRKKKIIVAVVVLLVLVIGCSAGSDDSDTDTKTAEPKTAEKKTTKKAATKKKAEEWNSTTKAVTDDSRAAAYETLLQNVLKDRTTEKPKFPAAYSDYEMTEKKYVKDKKKGYMVSVSCNKIKINGATHTAHMVAWVNKDAMDDLKDYDLQLLEFDGKKVTDSDDLQDVADVYGNDYEAKGNHAAEKVKTDAAAQGFQLTALDVTGNAHMTNGKEDAAAVDVILTQDTDDKTQAKTDGEKLKKIVLKYVKYGSVTVQKYKVNYQWSNY